MHTRVNKSKKHKKKKRKKKEKEKKEKFSYQDSAMAKALDQVMLDCGMNYELGILELFFKSNI